MTKHLRTIGIPIVFAAGVAWGTAAFLINNKVDAQVYAANLAQRAATDSTVLRKLNSLDEKVTSLTRYLCQGHERELGCMR